MKTKATYKREACEAVYRLADHCHLNQPRTAIDDIIRRIRAL